ncbi:unnamed protein product, partial [Rotaria sp. Silwood1]
MLNSFIITYTLCEPFVLKAKTLKEFIDRVVHLVDFDTNSLQHMKVVNGNAQIIRMWLSTEEATVFDNALVVMAHLYKTGEVTIRLRHLLHEESSLKINYLIDKIQPKTVSAQITNEETNDKNEEEQKNSDSSDDEEESKTNKMKITVSMFDFDIDEHKRQLTFCNVDLPANMSHIKILLDEQLKLLKLLGNIYSTFIKLEMSGHPNYQLTNKRYKIYNPR